MIEREVKAVLDDPAGTLRRLAAAGGRKVFEGLMEDRRFDRGTEFTVRDEVVRTRRYLADDGSPASWVIGWKGPVTVDRGAKLRREIEVESRGDVVGLLAALGFTPVHSIDRRVAIFQVGEATVRLEWYPRMDPLVEVEGDEGAIEAAVGILGIERGAFTAEPLTAFVERFRARGGQPAVSFAELGDALPSWSAK